jgi:hypothetical protein
MKTGRLEVMKRILISLPAIACVMAAAPAGAETLVRQHLDAGRVQFSGMDINGDGIADSIRLDRIKQALFYFIGNEKGNFVSFDPSALPEEERRFVPDVLVEEDLDGDEIEDLLLCNRAYLEKYSARERTFLRILAGSIYIGQPKGHYETLDDAVPSAEARTAILERARAIVLPEP